MSVFASKREKRLWLYVLIVLIAIILTLICGQSLVGVLDINDIQVAIFWLGFILIGATVLVHGLRLRPGKIELTIWLGLAAVYIFLFLRLGHAERSHMMEYSVLAIFIYEAFRERKSNGRPVPVPALLAIITTALIGVFDECSQLFISYRVFDPIDIIFNSLAAFMGVVSSKVLTWVRKRLRKS